ncbi:MAG: hypothetical protein ACF8PN_01820 [Phycisphaerales bacterium]
MLRSRQGQRVFIALLAIVTVPFLNGCYSQGGNRGYKGSPHSWISTTNQPLTLTLVDIRSGEELWTMDIPVNHKLVTRFRRGGGDDPINRPDRLDYELMDLRHRTGGLNSSISVPASHARRWESSVRPAPEYPPGADS